MQPARSRPAPPWRGVPGTGAAWTGWAVAAAVAGMVSWLVGVALIPPDARLEKGPVHLARVLRAHTAQLNAAALLAVLGAVLLAGFFAPRIRHGRPHLVTNSGSGTATFLVIQGIGDWDHVPFAKLIAGAGVSRQLVSTDPFGGYRSVPRYCAAERHLPAGAWIRGRSGSTGLPGRAVQWSRGPRRAAEYLALFPAYGKRGPRL
jgi:hypothetical protein